MTMPLLPIRTFVLAGAILLGLLSNADTQAELHQSSISAGPTNLPAALRAATDVYVKSLDAGARAPASTGFANRG